MRKEKFYGMWIVNLIILLLASIYLSVDVFADTECRDYGEYCSGLANGGQTEPSPYGNFCYYKDVVDKGNENGACIKRCVDRLKSEGVQDAENRCASNKCWEGAKAECTAGQKCTVSGCQAGDTSPASSPPLPTPTPSIVVTAPINTVTPMEEGSDVVKSFIIPEHEETVVSCSGGRIIKELQAYYFCKDSNGVVTASKFCPLSRIGSSGLTRGGEGQATALYWFDNVICGDPCNGVKKQGQLIARCVSTTAPDLSSGIKGDFNNDKVINPDDAKLFSDNFQKLVTQANVRFDLDRDNDIDFDDFFAFAELYPPTGGSPEATKILDGTIVAGKEVNQFSQGIVTCPSGERIKELQVYYYCPNDPIEDMRSTSCLIEKIGGSGLNDGGIGKELATYLFNGDVCKPDPCYGVVKKGRLIAKCIPSASAKVVAAKADFNDDGCVDMSDFRDFEVNFFKSVSGREKYDFDRDNDIDFDDFYLFASNYGNGCRGSLTPLPASDILVKRETEIAKAQESVRKPEQKSATINVPSLTLTKPIAQGCTPNKQADFSQNEKVDMDDYFLFAQHFNEDVNVNNKIFDLDNDNKVDFDDFFMFAEEFGKDICKNVLGDGERINLIGCNNKCDDVDGCSCSSECVLDNVDEGQTCGDKKPEKKTAVERIVETVKNIFTEPNHCEDGAKNKDEEQVDCGGKDCRECLEIREKSKTCKSLGYGERCDVEFKAKVNAGKGSGVNLPVVFEYNGKVNRKDSILSVTGDRGGSQIPAVTGTTVLDFTGEAITGIDADVSGAGLVTQSSRFNCVLVNKPEICCPFGFRTSSQDPNKCVRDEIVVVAEKNLYDRFLELAQKYLNAKGEEKEKIKRELRVLG